jgi:ABC-2 type transport system ATP-binding protein
MGMSSGQSVSDRQPAAALCGAAKRYGKHVALHGVDLRIERGRITALLGPNGAGKSTAVSLLLGLTAPDGGRAELFGESPRELRARRRMGVMLQSATLPETLRVRELLQLTSGYYPNPRSLDSIAQAAGIADLLPRFYGKLSGGQQRRVQFALALCGDPDLLCLDEPTVGMDTEARAHVWDVIRARVADGCAVLLTTHYLEEAEALAHHVAVLHSGRLVMEGTVDEVRSVAVRRYVRCVTRVPIEEVRGWSEVEAVMQDEGALRIETQQPERLTRRLLLADPDLTELEVQRAGLAEALSHLTKQNQERVQ